MSGTAFLGLACDVSLAILLLALFLCLVRLIRGPSLPDRILALDTMTMLALGFIAVIALRSGIYLYLDIAISIGIAGFLATVAFARYVHRKGRAGAAAEMQK